jgi:hypothetical protein
MALNDFISINTQATELINKSGEGKSPDVLYSHLDSIIGRPYSFLNNVDPNLRSFIRHMIPSAPLVMIKPGRVRFSEEPFEFINNALGSFGLDVTNLSKGSEGVKSALSGIFGDTDGKSTSGVFGSNYGVGAEDRKAINESIEKKRLATVMDVDAQKSIRYFEFDSNTNIQAEYMSVLSTLSSRIFTRLNRDSVLWSPIDSQIAEMSLGGFRTFWADNASSVSETVSAEVGATKLAGLVKGVSDISKEGQFFLGKGFGEKYRNASDQERQGGDIGNGIESAISAISSFVGGDSTGLRGSLGDAILGLNPMFPEVWKDSSFGRSYNLSFKFHSPYGSPAAIYQNVLLPFTMLLSLVMPVMMNPGVYSEPFVFQLDCPGYFACDLGICTDFTFIKGGSENLWSVDGLPLQIDVTMAVKDLYPVLVASKNNKSLYFNIGMSTFLDNMAGVSLFQSDAIGSDIITRTKSYLNSSLMQITSYPSGVMEDLKVLFEKLTPIPAMFRALDR